MMTMCHMQQTCQVSRIRRDSHASEHHLTLSRLDSPKMEKSHTCSPAPPTSANFQANKVQKLKFKVHNNELKFITAGDLECQKLIYTAMKFIMQTVGKVVPPPMYGTDCKDRSSTFHGVQSSQRRDPQGIDDYLTSLFA